MLPVPLAVRIFVHESRRDQLVHGTRHRGRIFPREHGTEHLVGPGTDTGVHSEDPVAPLRDDESR